MSEHSEHAGERGEHAIRLSIGRTALVPRRAAERSEVGR